MTVELPLVDFALTPEQQLLAETLRSFFAVHTPLPPFGEKIGPDSERLRALGSQLDVLGLDVSAELGGAGATMAEAVLLNIEAGRSLCSLPLVNLSAATTLLAGANDELLAPVLAGEVLVDVAGMQPDSRPSARVGAHGVVIEGSCPTVLGGDAASALVIADSPVGLLVAVVEADAPGVLVHPAESLDLSRRWCTHSFDSVVGRLLIPPTQQPQIQASIDRAMIAVAADQVGICLQMVEVAVEYAKVRFQFGRAIGAQQAIKHRLVDMSLWAERASAAVDYAARNATHETGHLTSLVAFEFCTRAAVEVTTGAIQVLGGIGMTWEHPVHRYLRRALGNQGLFGAPRVVRRELAGLLWPRTSSAEPVVVTIDQA